MPGFEIIPDEERDLSRYHRSITTTPTTVETKKEISEEEKAKAIKEFEEALQKIIKKDREADKKMREEFARADREYEKKKEEAKRLYPRAASYIDSIL